MKKALFFTILIFNFIAGFSQSVVDRSSDVITTADSRLMAKLNLFIPTYADTSDANLHIGIDSCGAVIFTYDVNAMWYRQCGPKKWVLMGGWLTPTGNGSGLTGLTAAQVGLGNVNNTSDANKPVSTATANALALKQNTIVTGSPAQYIAGDLSLITFPTTTAPFSNSTNKNFVTDAQLTAVNNTTGTNSGDNAANTTYANDYRAANFVAGTNYVAPNGNGSSITGLTSAQVGLGNVDNTSNATERAAVATLTNKTIDAANNTLSNIPQAAVTNLTSDLAAKQETLVSTINIKTVNGGSVLGSGDLVVTGGTSRVFLPSDVINNNAVANTIADVTGLSFPVSANVTYAFKFWIIYSSAATTTGSRWSINGPATTFMNYYANYTLSASGITNNQGLAAYNAPSGASASSLASGNICIIQGVIRPSASGNVIARFASEISSSAITAIASGRSYVEYQIIN